MTPGNKSNTAPFQHHRITHDHPKFHNKGYATKYPSTETNKNSTLIQNSKNNLTSNFDTQHLVIVDHNCEAGKQPDDNGDCVPEE